MKLSKKNIFILLTFCFLFLVVAFSFQYGFRFVPSSDLATDSGFDSDFGGDSGGGGSDSFGSDHDGSSGGTVYKIWDLNSLIISIIVTMCVIFPILVIRGKKNGNEDYLFELGLSFRYGVCLYAVLYTCVVFNFMFGSPGGVTVLIVLIIIILPILILFIYAFITEKKRLDKEDARCFEGVLENPSIVKEAYDIYVRIQLAWAKNNLEDVRDVLSSEMYNMYNSQIQTMIRKKERNVMSDFKFVKGGIREYQNVNGQDRYVVILQVLCKDYMVDEKRHIVTRGSYMKKNNYIYSLTFLRNKNVDLDKCPNCDAELPSNGQNVKCSYCGSVIERKNTNLVLVDKKMLSQRRL